MILFIYLLNAKLYKQIVFDFEIIYRYIKVKIDLVICPFHTCNICKEIIKLIIIIMFDYYISLFFKETNLGII